MNERIKLLAEQSEVEYYRTVDMFNQKDIIHTKFDKEKFAELIIRECARIGELKEQGSSEYDPSVSVGWYMKQYFGVKND